MIKNRGVDKTFSWKLRQIGKRVRKAIEADFFINYSFFIGLDFKVLTSEGAVGMTAPSLFFRLGLLE